MNSLGRFNKCYREQHWVVAKRLLRYLKGTKSVGLQYEKGKRKYIIVGNAYTDFAGDSDVRIQDLYPIFKNGLFQGRA